MPGSSELLLGGAGEGRGVLLVKPGLPTPLNVFVPFNKNSSVFIFEERVQC